MNPEIFTEEIKNEIRRYVTLMSKNKDYFLLYVQFGIKPGLDESVVNSVNSLSNQKPSSHDKFVDDVVNEILKNNLIAKEFGDRSPMLVDFYTSKNNQDFVNAINFDSKKISEDNILKKIEEFNIKLKDMSAIYDRQSMSCDPFEDPPISRHIDALSTSLRVLKFKLLVLDLQKQLSEQSYSKPQNSMDQVNKTSSSNSHEGPNSDISRKHNR